MDIKIIENTRIKEKLYHKETETGLKVFYIPKEGYTKQYAIFGTDYGSLDNFFTPLGEEDILEVPEGIAHFLEHKLFESQEDNLFDEFSKLGADVNAYTSFNQTAYLFTSTENFYENLELLINFVQEPYFTDENVEKEKGIIGQEINMYKDNPGWRVYFNCLKAMYNDHPVRIDIAGTIDSIAKIDKELLYKCYSTFYNPSNMILFLIGDLDFNKILETVNRVEKKDVSNNQTINRLMPEENDEINTKYIEEKMMTSAPIFYIGVKDIQPSEKGEDLIKKDLITNILLDMLFGNSSKFYNDLYEEGLIDSSFGGHYTGRESYGHSLIMGESKEAKEVYNRVLDLFKKEPHDILLADDFNRIRRKEIGDYLMGLNSIEFIGNNFVDMYFSGFLLTNYLEVLEKIQYEDIVARFKEHFKEDFIVLSIINPLDK